MDNKFMQVEYDMRNKFKHADVKKFFITKKGASAAPGGKAPHFSSNS